MPLQRRDIIRSTKHLPLAIQRYHLIRRVLIPRVVHNRRLEVRPGCIDEADRVRARRAKQLPRCQLGRAVPPSVAGAVGGVTDDGKVGRSRGLCSPVETVRAVCESVSICLSAIRMSLALTSLNIAYAKVNLPEGVRVRVELLEERLLTPSKEPLARTPHP